MQQQTNVHVVMPEDLEIQLEPTQTPHEADDPAQGYRH
jgi:hypothetical protein